MKRYGNLYHKIVDIENLKLAHKNARKGKVKYKEVIEVDNNIDFYIDQLHEILTNGTYRCSEYKRFIKKDSGKEREIFKVPYFPDRIVQHAILQVIEPIWKKTLIVDTFQAIKGRGVHKCKRKVEYAVQVLGNKYCLQMDVKKFYPSISNKVLKETVRRKIKCKSTLMLLDSIIEGHEGVPIGNYISQYFGNLVLSDIDHYCKEVLKTKHYFRYCDDILVISNDKEHLHQVRKEITRLLNNKGLEVKENYQVYKISKKRGVDCFGFNVHNKTTRLRKSIAKSFGEAVSKPDADTKIPAYYGWIKHLPNKVRFWGHTINKDKSSMTEEVRNKLTNKIRRDYEKSRK